MNIKWICCCAIAFPILVSGLFAQDIHTAVDTGDLKEVERFLGEDPSLCSAVDEWGIPVIVRAALMDKCAIAEYLISMGADIHAGNRWKDTALHYACANGNLELVRLLAEQGADMYAMNFRGETPAFTAVRYGNNSVVDILASSGYRLDHPDSEGNSLLAKAVVCAQQNVIPDLLGKGIDVDGVNGCGRTALHLAAIRGNSDAVGLLTEAGADPGCKDLRGNSSIDYARKFGHAGVYNYLSAQAGVPSAAPPFFGHSRQLAEKLDNGEAYIWYLGHSGWAVKTKNHLLVFDYILSEGNTYIPRNPGLANGHLDANELRDEHVTIFISHGHRDHYWKEITDLRDRVSDVSFIFGWKALDDTSFSYLTENREEMTVNGIRTESLVTPDPGSAFIVQADGLTMFFAGDYYSPDFRQEIDYMQKKYGRFDMAFILGARGPMEISDYIVEHIRAEAIFLMHAIDFEFVLAEYALSLTEKTEAKICSPEFRGDHYRYSNSTVLNIPFGNH